MSALTVFPIVVTILAALGVIGTRAGQKTTDRRREAAENARLLAGESREAEARAADAQAAQLEEENRRIRRDPRAFVYVNGLQMRHDLSGLTADHVETKRRREQAEAARSRLGDALWTGLQLAVRLACMVLVPSLFGVGAVLNVEIFIALNGGVSGPAPVMKGVGASVLELMLTLMIAHLLQHRQVRSLSWQLRLACALAMTILVVGYVASYAPQRSTQAYEKQIDLDNRLVAQAKDASPPDQTALTAAVDRQQADLARLHRAQSSDAAQATVFPLAEVLCGELALEGAAAVAWNRRRRQADRTVEALRAEEHGLTRSLQEGKDRAGYLTAARMQGAGVAGIPELLGTPPPPAQPAVGGGNPPYAAPSGGGRGAQRPSGETPPASPRAGPPVTAAPAPASPGRAVINLGGIAPTPSVQTPGGAAHNRGTDPSSSDPMNPHARWDLAGG